MHSRRFFLKSSAVAMFGTSAAPAWLARALYADDAPSPRKKVLVAILQRGAMDGLNVVIPHGEKAYYDLRPSLAIPRPNGTPDAAMDLDGFFGLHPALRPLKPIYDAGHLAMVHATGSPDPTRSHFEAQDFMESGTPGLKTGDGWLNRALIAEKAASPLRAVGVGTDLPHALRGANDAVSIANLEDFKVRDDRAARALERMYDDSRDRALNGAGREAFDAIHRVQAVEEENYVPEGGVKYPKSQLGQSLLQTARLIKSGVGLEVAFTDVGGWDHHVNEVGAKPTIGSLASLLSDFGQSLAAFYNDLGDRMADVCVVTMSEFGRTARENGSRGTDHGHANVMFAFGGNIRGGKIYGEWPGLEREQLYEQRDLNLTTDFRAVLGELVVRHLGNRDLSKVFPGFEPTGFRGLIKA
ncbi:MAG TPA: DUF1501 domain-containing protein [Bryobacteraceae bacterium]|jgi:uncharacterized protein (DUF1501 family)